MSEKSGPPAAGLKGESNSVDGTIWRQRCILSPSLISCCDMCRLGESVRLLEEAGIGMLHVDILDGHFSPSMPLEIGRASCRERVLIQV